MTRPSDPSRRLDGVAIKGLNKAGTLRVPGDLKELSIVEFRTIGTIGAGAPARAVAAHAARAGYPVLVSNSRGPGTLGDVVAAIGPSATAATFEEAVTADLVLLAVPFGAVPEVGRRIADWTGRVVIDMTNQFAESRPYRGFADMSPLTGSEWVAEHLPGVTLLKAFNAMFATYMAPDPRHKEGNQAVFLAGDDESAKDAFARTIERFGFAPVDLGALREGGALIQLGGPLSGKHFLFQG
jgi:predicted dinucleotide-binding enzyme